MNKKRSVGVTIVGLFILILGFLAFLTCLYIPLIRLSQPPLSLLEEYKREIPFLIFFALLFMGGIGTLSLKKWSRILVIILPISWLTRSFYYLYRFIRGSFSFEPLLFGIISKFIFPITFSIFLIVFFTRPKVKEQFK